MSEVGKVGEGAFYVGCPPLRKVRGQMPPLSSPRFRRHWTAQTFNCTDMRIVQF